MTAHVSTFYSFKGGVGRTLLLANVGVALARGHQRVLLWDLDLEAPGMHHIEGLKPRKPVAQGFLRWLMEWQQAEAAAAAPVPLEGHLLESFLALPYAVPEVPGLFVLPAYGERENFTGLYQQIDWHKFTVESPERGVALFQQLLDGLTGRLGYGHILLDSRTGITDLGGLLTAVLPHATVLVGNYSAQNTAGLLNVYRALQPAVAGKMPERRYGKLRRLLVASPVPLLETKQALEARRAVWNSQFETPPDETRVEIPFVERLLFGEELLVETAPQSPTARAYQEVAARLSELREERIQEEEAANLGDQLYPERARMRRMSGLEGFFDAGPSFEQRVEKLLRLLGYTVTRLEPQDSGADLQAQRKSGLLQERYRVVCKEIRRPLSLIEAQSLVKLLQPTGERSSENALMVVASGFSTAAIEFLQEARVLAFTLKDLERELFDFKPYLSRLRRSYEESTLARTYVPPKLKSLEVQGREAEALARGKAWARGESARLWLVVGEAGTGKTSFIQRLAYELAAAAEKDSDSPVPVTIPLKDFGGAVSLEGMLQEHMAARVGWRGDPAVLLHLLSVGRIVLLLDGLDELGVTEPSLLEEQLRQLARPTASEPEEPRGNRVLITSRAQHFRDERSAGLPARVSPLNTALGSVALALGAEVDELAGWDRQQLREFLVRSLGQEKAAQWDALLARIEARPELTSRPMLVEMLLPVASELSSYKGELSLGALFQLFIRHVLKSQGPLARMRLGRFLERLAHEARRDPRGRIHITKMIRLIGVPLRSTARQEASRLEPELSALPFLTRELGEYYQFKFKLFEEFFYARHLWNAAHRQRLAHALDAPPLTSDGAVFLVDLAASEDVEVLRSGVRQVLSGSYSPRISENALRLAYEWSCGTAGGANQSSQQEMRWFMPPQAHLEGADLRGARLAWAWLEGARLVETRLDGADLTAANLRGVEGHRLQARVSILDGADLGRAQLREADFSGSTAFHHAPLLEGTDLRGARLKGTAWRMPALSGELPPSRELRLARWGSRHVDGGSEVLLEPALPGSVSELAVSSDGTLFVTCGGQHPVLWDLASGRPLVTFVGHAACVNSVVFAPSGKLLASASDDGTVGVWDVSTGALLRSLRGHQAPLWQVAFSPDGGLLASCSVDGTARLWNPNTGEPVSVISAHAEKVWSVAFSPDGELLATGSEDQSIRIWRVASGAPVRTLEGHTKAVRSLVFNPRVPHQLISGSGDSTVKIWDLQEDTPPRELLAEDANVMRLACNGVNVAAITLQSEVLVWDAASGTQVGSVYGGGLGFGLAFVPGEEGQVAVAANQGIWLERPAAPESRVQRVRGAAGVCVSFLPGGRVVLGGEAGGARVWDTRTGASPMMLPTAQDVVASLAVSPDATELYTFSTDGVIRLWDIEAGRLLKVVEKLEDVGRLALSPDGGRLARTDGRSVRIWDVRAPRPKARFELSGLESSIWGIAFSPDGQILATASADKLVRLWDGHTGTAIRSLEGHTEDVYALAFSPKASLLASVGGEKTVRVWDVEKGEAAFTLEGHEDGPVSAVAFSPDGNLLMSGAWDFTVRVWSVRERKQVAVLEGHEGVLVGVAFSPEGDRVVTITMGGSARLWDTRTWRLLATFVWLEPGWATLAGSYALTSPEADTGRIAVRAGALLAPLTLFKDQCLRPELVQAVLAGQPVEPLKLELGMASRGLHPRDP
ncbi:KGGVGR-motif variant AAA ATPase [Hyalangium minutum]|uniref:NACHT domain-containing protein n=1 Tax=Hyalangium minutum TaxID=394096 RepID=A0A085WLQ4_9BACT|nr:pentapeptide repeat-containing protein [Hyalangium minutum]KFE68617.1 hypothetical protein DB31_7854 [Hyalangium minutum]